MKNTNTTLLLPPKVLGPFQAAFYTGVLILALGCKSEESSTGVHTIWWDDPQVWVTEYDDTDGKIAGEDGGSSGKDIDRGEKPTVTIQEDNDNQKPEAVTTTPPTATPKEDGYSNTSGEDIDIMVSVWWEEGKKAEVLALQYALFFPNDKTPNKSVSTMINLVELLADKSNTAQKVLRKFSRSFLIVKRNENLQNCLLNLFFYVRTKDEKYRENFWNFYKRLDLKGQKYASCVKDACILKDLIDKNT